MGKIIKLKESDLHEIVNKVIVSEQRNTIVKYGLTMDDIIENGDNSEVMYIGSRGVGVKEIQLILSVLKYDLGFYGPNDDGVDSKFGYRTKSAVEEFQKDEGIKDDGIVGIETANSFSKFYENLPKKGEENSNSVIGLGDYNDDVEIEVDRHEVENNEIVFPSKSSSASPPMKNRWGKEHHGYDISASKNIFRKNGNVPLVVCNKAGTVTFSGKINGYGNLVEIKHGENDYSAYGHLYNSNVSVGDRIDVGDVIGVEGTTGHSSGNHVHFEFRVNRTIKKNRGGRGTPDVEANNYSFIRPISDVDEYYYYQVGDNSWT